jgi:L,D-transpeptidase catalytic domain/Putative peptidoglycan binding domain
VSSSRETIVHGGVAVLVALACSWIATPTPAAAGGEAAATSHAAPAASMLKLGSHGAAVRALQHRLVDLGYLPVGAADGSFGSQTWHAVVAFQGWSGIGRDGVVGARTRAALAHAQRPVPWSHAEGMEVHISQQVLLLVRGGRVQRAIHVSTGKPGWPTPVGRFRVTERLTLSWSRPFQSWMPLAQYFYSGYAIHEYPEVPAYPASHGCVRVPEAEAARVWRFGRIGMRVWTG